MLPIPDLIRGGQELLLQQLGWCAVVLHASRSDANKIPKIKKITDLKRKNKDIYYFRTSQTLCTYWHYATHEASVADPHHFDADPDPAWHFDTDPNPDPTFHFNADPDPSLQIKAQNLDKVLKLAPFSYNLAFFICKLMWIWIDSAYHFEANAYPDPAYHVDADPDPTFQFDSDPGYTTLHDTHKFWV